MNDKFIYDEKTSVLFAPNGHALKKVQCPKAMNWNQLTVQDGEVRWRGCTQCHEHVVNLDAMEVSEAVSLLKRRGSKTCVHASSESRRVIFLRDRHAVPSATELKLDEKGRTVIRTARSAADINRAVNLGYWPDVRMVTYDRENLRAKVSVGQHVETGHIQISGDFRLGFRKIDDPIRLERRAEIAAIDASSKADADDEYTAMLREECEHDQWVEAIPFTSYYPHYQDSPIAAYLIPRQLPDRSSLWVEDPIEDLVGARWNQGDAYRIDALPGKLEGRRVVLGKLDPSTVRRFVG